MGKHAQLVIGPAGAGKSTYCKMMQEHCNASKRIVHVVNLDPAADDLGYDCSIDIRDLITLQDVMEDCKLGPNGGLIYCFEHLLENIDWFYEELNDYMDDYLFIDCPGQIELYSHIPLLSKFATSLQRLGYHVCCVYCLDSLFLEEPSKFIAGTFMALSAMIQFELPHVNVLTKYDLQVKNKEDLEEDEEISQIIPDMETFVNKLKVGPKFKKLNQAISGLISDFSLVGFLPLNYHDEESVEMVLNIIDHSIQYGEDLEPKEPKWGDEQDVDPDGGDFDQGIEEEME